MRTVYIHTLNGQPAGFFDGQICFARHFGPATLAASSLKQIRREQKASLARDKQYGDEGKWTYGYVRFRV